MGVSNYIPDAHVLDPDGDVIITLHNFDPPFPPLPFEGEQYPEEDGGSLLLETPPLETMKEQKFKKKMTKRMKREIEEMESRAQQASPTIAEELPPEIDHEAHAAEASEAAALEVEEEPSESYGTSEPDLPVAEPIFQFQASSAHLRLGSRYFKKALDGPFRESKFVSDGLRQIDAEGWDMAAFLIVMRIIHGHTRQIPRRIDLEMLAKVATIVDYYQCHETIEPFAEIWHSNLQPLTITNLVNEDLILLLLVSWVFSWPNEFKAVTRIAQTQSKEPLSTMGLPIPERIISTIDDQRQEALHEISSMFTTLLDNFRQEQPQCSELCSSISLGTLERALLYQKRLLFHHSSSLVGYSVALAMKTAREIKTPVWSSTSGSRFYSHSCLYGLGYQLENLTRNMKEFEGLDLESFERKGYQLIPLRLKQNISES